MATNSIQRQPRLYLVRSGEPGSLSEHREILDQLGTNTPNKINPTCSKKDEKKNSPEHLLAIEHVGQVRVGLMTRTELRNLYKATYTNWAGMKQRCKNDNAHKLDTAFRDFADFLEIMGPRPGPEMSLDRVNPLGDYTPDNVRWASKKTQARNRTNTVFLTYRGTRKPLVEWAEENKIDPLVYRSRKKAGWSDNEIIEGKRASTSSEITFSNELRDCWLYTPWPAAYRNQLEVLYQRNKDAYKNRLDFMERYSREQLRLLMDAIDAAAWPHEYTPTDAEAKELDKLTRNYEIWSSIYCDARAKYRNKSSYRLFCKKVPTGAERRLKEASTLNIRDKKV